MEERRKKKKKKRNDPSLYDLRLTDSQNSSKQEAKLVYDKGYAWVPKSEFFVGVPKGRGFFFFLRWGYPNWLHFVCNSPRSEIIIKSCI